MASSVIDLAKFVRGDVEKARRRKPDTGLTVSGWNATPEGAQHPKDARGRWTDNPVGQAIAQAYAKLQRGPGDWVPLADVRERLPDISRADVDAALQQMGNALDVFLIPWDNRKALRQRDHDAAFRFGGDENHALRIEGDLSDSAESEMPTPAKLGPVHGRWTDNPVGQAVGQAVSDVLARQGKKFDPDGTLVHVSDIRGELSDRFTRTELDTEFKRLSNAPGSGFLLIPQSNQKILTEEQRAGAVWLGNENRHLFSVTARDLPAPSERASVATMGDPKLHRDPISVADGLRGKPTADVRARLEQFSDEDLATAAKDFGVGARGRKGRIDSLVEALAGEESSEPTKQPRPEGGLFANVKVGTWAPDDIMGRVRERRAALPADLEGMATEFPDWDEDVLQAAKRAATEFARLAEQELVRRKSAQLNPPKPRKATARLTAKPAPDLGDRIARMRASTSPEEADTHLEGLTVPQLKELGRELGISVGSARKAEIRQRLVDRAVGFKLDMDAIGRTDLSRSGSAADRVNQLTAQINAATDPAERKRLRAERARLGAEVMQGAPAGDRAGRLTRPDVTREEVDAAMEGMTVVQLKELAAELAVAGAPISAKGTKAQIQDAIRQGAVGFRQHAAGIRGSGGWGLERFKGGDGRR